MKQVEETFQSVVVARSLLGSLGQPSQVQHHPDDRSCECALLKTLDSMLANPATPGLAIPHLKRGSNIINTASDAVCSSPFPLTQDADFSAQAYI